MASDEHGEQAPYERRAFLKRMAALAFAAPVVSSFLLDGSAYAGGRDHGNHQYKGNQTGRSCGDDRNRQHYNRVD